MKEFKDGMEFFSLSSDICQKPDYAAFVISPSSALHPSYYSHILLCVIWVQIQEVSYNEFLDSLFKTIGFHLITINNAFSKCNYFLKLFK